MIPKHLASKPQTGEDRKTGSKPDVLFNTRDDTVSKVSKSAQVAAATEGTKAAEKTRWELFRPCGPPLSETPRGPSGTDSDPGSRHSEDSHVPTPQILRGYQDTPPYREYDEENLVGRRVDMRRLGAAAEVLELGCLVDSAAPEGGPERPEPAKKQKQNDARKKLQGPSHFTPPRSRKGDLSRSTGRARSCHEIPAVRIRFRAAAQRNPAGRKPAVTPTTIGPPGPSRPTSRARRVRGTVSRTEKRDHKPSSRGASGRRGSRSHHGQTREIDAIYSQ